MSKKINLEEILKSHSNICLDDYEDVLEAMKEACRQALELAAENADWEATSDCVIVRGDIFINKQSILDTINQIE